jgi:hypothetical protein
MSSERFLELQTETKPRAGVIANSLRIVRIVDFASPGAGQATQAADLSPFQPMPGLDLKPSVVPLIAADNRQPVANAPSIASPGSAQ